MRESHLVRMFANPVFSLIVPIRAFVVIIILEVLCALVGKLSVQGGARAAGLRLQTASMGTPEYNGASECRLAVLVLRTLDSETATRGHRHTPLTHHKT